MCVSRLPCGHDGDTAQCSPPQPTPQLSVCNLLAQERRATYEPQPMFNLWGTTMTEIRKEQTCTIRAMTQVLASMCWSSSDSLCEIPSVTATAAFRARMERTNPCGMPAQEDPRCTPERSQKNDGVGPLCCFKKSVVGSFIHDATFMPHNCHCPLLFYLLF